MSNVTLHIVICVTSKSSRSIVLHRKVLEVLEALKIKETYRYNFYNLPNSDIDSRQICRSVRFRDPAFSRLGRGRVCLGG